MGIKCSCEPVCINAGSNVIGLLLFSVQPFWPMGTGCARGFLAAFDTAWMVRGWAQGRDPLEILSER